MFGTDYLGQDVLSRLMYGGDTILLISVLATALGMVVGILIGAVAADSGGWWDEVIMRLNDVLLAFPQNPLALSRSPHSRIPRPGSSSCWGATLHAPRVARVSRGVALGIVSRDFVVAAEALGQHGPGDRRRGAAQHDRPAAGRGRPAAHLLIGLVAALGFLGFAADPGAANWGR